MKNKHQENLASGKTEQDTAEQIERIADRLGDRAMQDAETMQDAGYGQRHFMGLHVDRVAEDNQGNKTERTTSIRGGPWKDSSFRPIVGYFETPLNIDGSYGNFGRTDRFMNAERSKDWDILIGERKEGKIGKRDHIKSDALDSAKSIRKAMRKAGRREFVNREVEVKDGKVIGKIVTKRRFRGERTKDMTLDDSVSAAARVLGGIRGELAAHEIAREDKEKQA